MPQFLYPLVVLACPIGMGLMMWMMMRGGNKNEADSAPATSEEIAMLRNEVEHLRTFQAPQPDLTSGAAEH